jgi:hypothetical protein
MTNYRGGWKVGTLCVSFLLSLLATEHSAAEPSDVARVYPQGKVFPFMGYSGAPHRDALFGFSVAGPSYAADQDARLDEAEANGLSFPYAISISMNFHAKSPDKPLNLSESEIRQRITVQVEKVVNRQSICWWYLRPEELRWWRKNEMGYMKAASEAIRAADPLKRPIWMYEPNARGAESLQKTGRYQDIIGKGFYVNLAGYRDHRIWVRWSMEQQTKAIAALAREEGHNARHRIPLVLPELCKDPEDPTMDHLIPRWARHDIYLGLMCGGKGVAIWSLFQRNDVKRTWPIWYNAYSRAAIELTGPMGLGQVFLFGQRSNKFPIDITFGPKKLELTKGGNETLEAVTTNDSEKQEKRITYPSVCVSEYEHGDATYLFLCNSSGTKRVDFQSTALTDEWKVIDVFASRGYGHKDNRLYGWLAPLDVRCYRITRREE